MEKNERKLQHDNKILEKSQRDIRKCTIKRIRYRKTVRNPIKKEYHKVSKKRREIRQRADAESTEIIWESNKEKTKIIQ